MPNTDDMAAIDWPDWAGRLAAGLQIVLLPVTLPDNVEANREQAGRILADFNRAMALLDHPATPPASTPKLAVVPSNADCDPGDRCALCGQPEGETHMGAFTRYRGTVAHRGCALDADSDMADDYYARARR